VKRQTDSVHFLKEGVDNFTNIVFLEILREVCQAMGIPRPGQPLASNQSAFSDDLLSIELCGPEKQNLSIIDISDIFRTPIEGVTIEADMALV